MVPRCRGSTVVPRNTTIQCCLIIDNDASTLAMLVIDGNIGTFTAVDLVQFLLTLNAKMAFDARVHHLLRVF